MGFGPEVCTKVETRKESKKTEIRKKKKIKKKGFDGEESGCWVKFSFRNCMPSRSKVDSFLSGTSASYGKFLFFF